MMVMGNILFLEWKKQPFQSFLSFPSELELFCASPRYQQICGWLHGGGFIECGELLGHAYQSEGLYLNFSDYLQTF